MKKAKINELKELEKMATRIAKKRERLEAQMKAEKEMAKWYDEVLKESGLKRPRDMIKAMMEHFGFRTISLTKGARGPGRPPKAAPAAKGNSAGKRKRTKVTAGVRDSVKEALEKGVSKNAASKKFGISYIVIKKIQDGAYDQL
ncbi:MAG TPA: hypothetical protein VK995_03115 [Oceanipulchritudo sp.]|nr:hypothetical protein [Oceanipulchritudo sp.]